MKFEDALTGLANYLTLDAKTLTAYAAEDTVGGRDTGWNYLAVTADEGRVLYALTCIFRPDSVIEVGTGEGCSASHFLSAMKATNYGVVISIDTNANAGERVTIELAERWEMRIADGIEALADYKECEHDFILEDSVHTYDHTAKVLTAAKALNPALLICHDVLSFPAVQRAWYEVSNGPIFRFGDNSAGLGFLKGGAWL